MPEVPLPIDFNTPESSIMGICESHLLKGKEVNEVWHVLDGLGPWRKRWETVNGPLKSIIHHSNPDDPPDVTLVFQSNKIGVEHTRLEPRVNGWSSAIHRRELADRCVVVPSITVQPANKSELLKSMFDFGGTHDLVEELDRWRDYTFEVIRKKIEGRKPGVLVMQSNVLPTSLGLDVISEVTHRMLMQAPHILGEWVIVIHSRANSYQYHSYLIAANEPLAFHQNP